MTSELTVTVEHAGRTYRAIVDLVARRDGDSGPLTLPVSIDIDGAWAGSGRLVARRDEYSIVDCAAVLGGSQDSADEIYVLLDEAISAAMVQS